MIITAIITIIAAYLLGSIDFAIIFTNAFLKKDVRTIGSGNAGTTNVMRNAGFVPGALTFIFDTLKGFISALMGKMIFDYILTTTGATWAQPIYGAYICGLACMLGHVFPIFFGFRGGKGVATGLGIYAVCSYPAAIIALAVFALCLLISRLVSLSSVTAVVIVVVCSIIFNDSNAGILPQIILSAAMGVLVIVMHRENIKRIIAGTESKIGKGNK